MKRYFPFLRGKQNELMALRELAHAIAEHGSIIPIIEPVNGNQTTRISLDRYVEVSMPFLFVSNPAFGDFANDPEPLFTGLTSEVLMEYDNWTPALQVNVNSTAAAITAFRQRYAHFEAAVIYNGLPANAAAVAQLTDEHLAHHVFIEGTVGAAYINAIDPARRVMIADRFHRQPRNADYPATEFFSDANTVVDNPSRLDFGDYSIVGNHFAESGGPAYAVAVHHIHFEGDAPGPLHINHYLSDHQDAAVNTSGKVVEAVHNLVAEVDDLHPHDTAACDEYRDIDHEQTSRGLGYLKRLAIQHHLEIMLNGGIVL
jgi:hypothetical protein